jgi:hypothetical protein
MKLSDELFSRASDCASLFQEALRTTHVYSEHFLSSLQGDFNLWCSAARISDPGRHAFDPALLKDNQRQKELCKLLASLSAALGRYQQAAAGMFSNDFAPKLKLFVKLTFFHNTASRSTGLPDPREANDASDSLSENASVVSWNTISARGSEFNFFEVENLDHPDPMIREQLGHIRILLLQLNRVILDVQKRSQGIRFAEADASFDEEDYVEFRDYLVSKIYEHRAKEKDSIPPYAALPKAQRHLIRANIIRKHRREHGRSAATSDASSVQRTDPSSEHQISERKPRTTENPPRGLPSATAKSPALMKAGDRPSELASADHALVHGHDTASGQARDRENPSSPSFSSPPQDAQHGRTCPYCNDTVPQGILKDHTRWR